MGEIDRNRTTSSREMTTIDLSLQIDKYPEDRRLHRFISETSESQNHANLHDVDDDGEVELNLGLSLGGRFGVDKNKSGALKRSSSIAGTMEIFRDDEAAAVTPSVPYMTLIRTTSLPTETEEEWRKRKEMQTLRRLEAKRRRSEKQKNSNVAAITRTLSAVKNEAGLPEETSRVPSTAALCGLPTWVASKVGVLQSPRDGSVDSRGRGDAAGGGSGGGRGSSVNMWESELKPVPVLNSCAEATTTLPTTQEGNNNNHNHNREGASGSGTKKNGTPPRITRSDSGKESVSVTGDMPCVFTKGEGPNGRRVEGILYRYGRGEDVRIICVCHGTFHTPAEFVKHAGGVDVDNPLKHIVVNTSTSSLM